MSPQIKKILIIGVPILLRKLFRGKKIFQNIGLMLLVLIAVSWLIIQYPFIVSDTNESRESSSNQSEILSSEQSNISSLYDAQISGVMVSTRGNVIRILQDDNDGSRHQRFLIRIPDGLTLLIAHNIDLAPRVPIELHDQVSIYGQYEWNEKGGVLHWTHHDPDKNHPEGWIMHEGVKYD